MSKLVKRISDGVIFEVNDNFKLGNEFVEVTREKEEYRITRDDVTPASSKVRTGKEK